MDDGFGGGGASCRVPKLLAADNIDISILGSGDRNYIRGKATKSKGQSVTTYTRRGNAFILEYVLVTFSHRNCFKAIIESMRMMICYFVKAVHLLRTQLPG